MNQVTNFKQWKNCTEEEQAGFDFEGFKYERQGSIKEWYPIIEAPQCGDGVIRLVIQPEKLYYVNNKSYNGVVQGHTIQADDYSTIRPATEAEIPKPENEYKHGDIYAAKDTNEVILLRECGNGIMEWITASQDNWVGLSDRQIFITHPEFYKLIYREGKS